VSQVSQVRVIAYVLTVVALATTALVVSADTAGTLPALSGLFTFFLVALFLELGGTKLQHGAKGSFVFVVHLGAALTFGPFWGGSLVLATALVVELASRRSLLKAGFNVSQKVLSTVGGTQLYILFGGTLPFGSIEADLLPFVGMSLFYFAANSLSVSAAIALSTGAPFAQIWNQNSRGLLVYDLLASGFALLVTWLYSRYGATGLVGVILPAIVLRSVYGMYRQVEAQTREMLDLMVKAIEARDPYTSGHSVRVAAMSRAIATEMKLPYERVEEIATAALLHDVGKIHEKFAPMLRKPDKLSDEERQLLEEHPVKSADLVGVISGFRGTVLDSVRGHHERWDGNGYPDRLKGAEIPLGARIITVADTVDAMRTDRPYRPAATYEQTLAELQRCRGVQFDPQVIDVALGSMLVRSMFAAPQDVRGLSEQPAVEIEPRRRRSSGWMRVLR
jgi:hypothetical protein